MSGVTQGAGRTSLSSLPTRCSETSWGDRKKTIQQLHCKQQEAQLRRLSFQGFWPGSAPTRTTVHVTVSKHTEDTDHKVINTGQIKIMDYLNGKGKPLYRYCREISNGCSCPGWGVVRKNLGGWGF